MSNTAPMGMNLGEARRRQEAAKRRGERFKVSDDVRAVRAAIMEKRNAIHDQRQAEARAELEARPDAVRAILAHASIDELAEFQRVAGQLDGRRLADIVADVLRQRQRTSYVAQPEPTPVEQAATAPETAQEAAPASKASTPRRTRKQAS
ncbi:hypothetical protein [Methylobacterium sp. NFXW15]|uniref:hypothetical protein n=1 Tax=Methylobacterium sp. NFXW15 TaxID=2819512 RepID=UPI003CF4426F